MRFENNAYFAIGGSPTVKWGGSAVYQTVAAWAEATGQEMVDGRLQAWVMDPLLCAPGAGGSLPDGPRSLSALTAYRLHPDSPLIDGGWDLLTGYGLDMGTQDFFGSPPWAGAAPDIGAHEWREGEGCE